MEMTITIEDTKEQNSNRNKTEQEFYDNLIRTILRLEINSNKSK